MKLRASLTSRNTLNCKLLCALMVGFVNNYSKDKQNMEKTYVQKVKMLLRIRFFNNLPFSA
jgi:hypothetical protein